MNTGSWRPEPPTALPMKVVVPQLVRRRHCQAVAEAVLKGSSVRATARCTRRTFVSGAADGFVTRCAWSTRRTGLASSRSSSRSTDPAFLNYDRPDAGIPMVWPGQGYAEMITGQFIPSRHRGRHKLLPLVNVLKMEEHGHQHSHPPTARLPLARHQAGRCRRSS